MTEWRRDGYVVTDDPARVDVDVVHDYLSNHSYWAPHRTRDDTAAASAASWCFTLVDEASGAQVGFARLVTDRVTFGWLADVIVDPERRGLGLGKLLVEGIVEEVDALGLRRTLLMTRDAHTLYGRHGWEPAAPVGDWLVRWRH